MFVFYDVGADLKYIDKSLSISRLETENAEQDVCHRNQPKHILFWLIKFPEALAINVANSFSLIAGSQVYEHVSGFA
jgi:hypothetical protein